MQRLLFLSGRSLTRLSSRSFSVALLGPHRSPAAHPSRPLHLSTRIDDASFNRAALLSMPRIHRLLIINIRPSRSACHIFPGTPRICFHRLSVRVALFVQQAQSRGAESQRRQRRKQYLFDQPFHSCPHARQRRHPQPQRIAFSSAGASSSATAHAPSALPSTFFC